MHNSRPQGEAAYENKRDGAKDPPSVCYGDGTGEEAGTNQVAQDVQQLRVSPGRVLVDSRFGQKTTFQACTLRPPSPYPPRPFHTPRSCRPSPSR